eukprot:1227738-Rhodomonas_salina.1
MPALVTPQCRYTHRDTDPRRRIGRTADHYEHARDDTSRRIGHATYQDKCRVSACRGLTWVAALALLLPLGPLHSLRAARPCQQRAWCSACEGCQRGAAA